jgi:hypothetical protein
MPPDADVGEPAGNLDCAWCGDRFPEIVPLLEHVERQHLSDDEAA